MNKSEAFRKVSDGLADLYERKNHDYGDSFGVSVRKYGLIAALTRISDKFNRLESLILKGRPQVNESMCDTALDLAAYAIMLTLEINKEYDPK